MRTRLGFFGASGSHRLAKPAVLYALIAATAIAAGVLVYAFDRSSESIYFLPDAFASGSGWFGAFGGVLPAFLHVYAFILLTGAVIPESARRFSICLFWLGIETLFELGQHASIAPSIAAALPVWLEPVPILGRTASYFLHGTFDPWDLAAIFVGTLAAYRTLTVIAQRDASHEPQS